MLRWTSTALRTASTALANSTSIPSPVVLTMRPRWEAMVGSTRVFLRAFSRASVPSSSPHQTAIPGNIRRQHCRQSPFRPLAGQGTPLQSVYSTLDIKAQGSATGLGAMFRNGSIATEACWRFAAVSHPPVIRQKPREQTRTNVNDLDRETLNLLELPGRVLRSCEYSIAVPTARRICVQRCKKSFATQSINERRGVGNVG